MSMGQALGVLRVAPPERFGTGRRTRRQTGQSVAFWGDGSVSWVLARHGIRKSASTASRSRCPSEAIVS